LRDKTRWDIIPSGVLGNPFAKSGLQTIIEPVSSDEDEGAEGQADEIEVAGGAVPDQEQRVVLAEAAEAEVPALPAKEGHRKKNQQADDHGHKEQQRKGNDDMCAVRMLACLRTRHQATAGCALCPTTRFAYSFVLAVAKDVRGDDDLMFEETVLRVAFPVLQHYTQLFWVTCSFVHSSGTLADRVTWVEIDKPIVIMGSLEILNQVHTSYKQVMDNDECKVVVFQAALLDSFLHCCHYRCQSATVANTC
jgi:hypothetical protein